jgi:toxin ParE1/3/4
LNIAWHPLARLDLVEIITHIAEENLSAAYRIQNQIESQVSLLAQMPEMGRKGRLRGTRELVIAGTPYLVAYRIRTATVLVLRVLHGARRWPSRL